jgi:hypothetical protein
MLVALQVSLTTATQGNSCKKAKKKYSPKGRANQVLTIFQMQRQQKTDQVLVVIKNRPQRGK